MPEVIWQRCVDRLQHEIPVKQFNTWIRPLNAVQSENEMTLFAPNRFIRDFVSERFAPRIQQLLGELSETGTVVVSVEIERGTVRGAATEGQSSSGHAGPGHAGPGHAMPGQIIPGSRVVVSAIPAPVSDLDLVISPQVAQDDAGLDAPSLSGDAIEVARRVSEVRPASVEVAESAAAGNPRSSRQQLVTASERTGQVRSKLASAPDHQSKLIGNYTFESFVEGKSNQLALAAARQVAENPGHSYNPLFLYGGVGLGKTHLMHAVGNALRKENSAAKIVYLHSETFVGDMVKALQLNAISEFKRFYRSVDALLIDDIQFFARKERSQEEFFHTFNALLEGGQQMILTCDRYPKEIDGLEERLKSRFGWGLTVAVEPPELETRVAILMKKAGESEISLPHDAAFFIAQRIRSNVRELEGALRRVIANARFTNTPIDIPLVKDSLKDLLALQDKQVSLDNIQRTVADYYKIKVSDLMSRRRNRSVARPRQMAMALSKELTSHSLPEIGDSFGGRDHTTVLHACRKIKELRNTNSDIRDDFKNLLRSLTT